MATVFSNLITPSSVDKEKQSSDWYNNKIQQVTDPNDVLKNTIAIHYIIPGFMYLFNYDAKHKDKYPDFDPFPLVFPFRRLEGGFLGINLNYVAPRDKAKLIDQLNLIVLNKEYNEALKLRLTHYVVQRISREPRYDQAIRHYLNNHVKSRYIVISPTEWDNVLNLTPREAQEEIRRTVFKQTRT